jgi:DNA-binding MarR family transcriptional regulator
MQVMNHVPGCRVADIAQALSITVGGVSKLVDRIEHAGWCGRAPNPDDARSSILHLTGAGRRLLDDAQESFEDELELSLGGTLRPAQLASLATAVRAIRHGLADRTGSDR